MTHRRVMKQLCYPGQRSELAPHRRTLDSGGYYSWLQHGYAPLEKAELAPELVKLLPELSIRPASVNPVPGLEPEQEKRRLFAALAQFLKSVTETGDSPLLFIIEDLHWSDDTTLEFLLFLARRIAT